MKWNVHEVNLKDWQGVSREDICKEITENRTLHREWLGKKWNLEGKEREDAEKILDDLDIREMILQTVLEEMDMGFL